MQPALPPDTILAGLEPDTGDADAWTSSRWSWIRALPPASKGAIGARLVQAWLTSAGFTCTRPSDSDADLVADGVRVEVKLSCRWADGSFRFQQIRDQRWDVLVAVGVEPSAVRLWVLTKADALSLSTGQHTGASAAETRWATWLPTDAPSATGSTTGDSTVAAQRFATIASAITDTRRATT